MKRKKHVWWLTLLLRFRRFAQDTTNMIIQVNNNVLGLQTRIDNHICHRLNDQDVRLEHIETKIDIITKIITPPQS